MSKADVRTLDIFGHYEIELLCSIFDEFVNGHRVNFGG